MEAGQQRLRVCSGNLWPLHNRSVFLQPGEQPRPSATAVISQRSSESQSQKEQSFHSLGFTSQSLHPNPEETGKWTFQLSALGGTEPGGWRQKLLPLCSVAPSRRASTAAAAAAQQDFHLLPLQPWSLDKSQSCLEERSASRNKKRFSEKLQKAKRIFKTFVVAASKREVMS